MITPFQKTLTPLLKIYANVAHSYPQNSRFLRKDACQLDLSQHYLLNLQGLVLSRFGKLVTDSPGSLS